MLSSSFQARGWKRLLSYDYLAAAYRVAALAALFSLSGCGSGVPAAPALSVSPATLSTSSLAFGQLTVGTTLSQQVTLSNNGAVPFASVDATLSDATNFAVSSTCGSGLPAGASCTLTLTFQPKSAGSLSATLSLRDSASNSPQTLSLAGTGTAVPLPQATLLPGSLAFASTDVGTVSSAMTVTLSNTGNTALAIAGIGLDDPADFSMNSSCGNSLAPAAACSVVVTFRPQAHAAYAATLTVIDNAGGVAGATQTVSLSGAGALPVSSVANFGDSITCGYYASPGNGTGYVYSLNGYAGLFDAALGKPAQNFCRPGDQAADTARLWVQNVTPALAQNQLFTLMIGTNDSNACGASAVCLRNYQFSTQAALAWLAMPASDKFTTANIPARGGNWVNDLLTDLATTGANATLDFTVAPTAANRPLYVAYRVINDPYLQGGAATISVDGVPAATLNTIPTAPQTLYTQNGLHDSVFLAEVPLGAAGPHSIHVQTSSAGGYWAMMWAGVATANYAGMSGAPRVLVAGVPTTTSLSLNTTVDQYNAVLSACVAEFRAQGLNVDMVPTANVLDATADLADLVHPNTAGHAKLAAAFKGVL